MIESLSVSANVGNYKSYRSHNIQTIGSVLATIGFD